MGAAGAVDDDVGPPLAFLAVGEGLRVQLRLERCGLYGEGGYAFTLFELDWRAVFRAERFDDDRALEDAGDGLLLTGGLDLSLFRGYAQAQFQYQARREIYGAERDNDTLVVSLQGAF